MAITSFKHRELKKLYNGKAAKLDARWIDAIEDIFDVLEDMDSVEDVIGYRGCHALTGNRKGDYAFFVTKNWRLTFSLDDDGNAAGLDLEDYH